MFNNLLIYEYALKNLAKIPKRWKDRITQL